MVELLVSMDHMSYRITCASQHSSVHAGGARFAARTKCTPHLLRDFQKHVGVRDVLALLEVPVKQLLDHVSAFVLLVGEADQAVRPDRVVHPPVFVEVDAGRLARPLQRHCHPRTGALAVLLLQVFLVQQQRAREWKDAAAAAKVN